MMRVGEAYEKVAKEIAEHIAQQVGSESPSVNMEAIDDMSMGDLQKLTEVTGDYKPLLYDGSANDFVRSRARKLAEAHIATCVEQGLDFTNADEIARDMAESLPMLAKEALSFVAMGYSFAAPEFKNVERDKEGFLKLCREVDRDLIAIQVAQFANDEMLCERIQGQIELSAAFTSQLFSMLHRPITKFVYRDWITQCFATSALNCFIAGHRVRDLLEQEAMFEAMMKEND